MTAHSRYPAYRQSGVDWLGDLPAHWQSRRLKFDLSRNDSGVWGEDVDEGESGTLVLRSTEVNLDGTWNLENPACRKLSADEFRKAVLLEGDLLITKSSGSEQHLGKVSIVTREIADLGCAFSNFMQRLRVTRHNDPKFLFYLLNCDVGKEQLGFLGSTTTGLRNLSAFVISEVILPGPPLPEQRAIVAFLDRETAHIDTLIAKKRELIDLLNQQRTALISHAVTRGLNPGFPIKTSKLDWLDEVPQHCEVVPIKYRFEVQLGKMLQPNAIGPEDTLEPYLRAANINWKRVSLEDVKEMWFSPNEKRIHKLKQNDLLISEGGDVGRSSIWNGEMENCYIQNSINRVRGKGNNSTQFLYYWIYFLKKVGYIDILCNKATIAHYTAVKVANTFVALPPIEEQLAIVKYLYSEMSRIEELEERVKESILLLQNKRTALVSAAVTGKIDVRAQGQS